MDTDYKEKEMIERNIELSAEFSRYLFEHPENETSMTFGQKGGRNPPFGCYSSLRRLKCQLQVKVVFIRVYL